MTRHAEVLLPGVDVHHGAYRVRKQVAGRRIIETGLTLDVANRRALEIEQMRACGVVPAQAASSERTLRAEAEALLARKRTTVSRKTKRRLRASGLEWWERAVRPWREGAYAELPLSLLRFDMLEDMLLARAAEHPKSARDEQDGLKAILRAAARRGARFDQALLAMERIQVSPRKRVALAGEELVLLTSQRPEYGQRMIRFTGTTGMRIGEVFAITVDRVHLDERAIFVPAALCKEGVDKWVDLTSAEVAEVRRQLIERAPGTELLFPTKTGQQWRHFQFLRLVWYKARARAAEVWRDERGLPEEAETPFDGIQPHDLRATAATLMRDAGFSKEEAAARLGHADSGALLDRIYDQGDRRARTRKAIDALAPHGLLAAASAEPDALREAEAK